MNYKIEVMEEVKKEFERALKNFDLFLDLCQKKEVVVTDQDKDVILLLITTMVEHNLETIDSDDWSYILDDDFVLGIIEDGRKYDCLSYPEKFLEALREDADSGLIEYLDENFTIAIEVKVAQ
jgi:hypothetical protein